MEEIDSRLRKQIKTDFKSDTEDKPSVSDIKEADDRTNKRTFESKKEKQEFNKTMQEM